MDINKEEIIAQRSKLSPERRLLLEKRLRGEIETNSQLNIIPRRSSTNPIPLSFAQKRLWFLDQLEHNNSYNEPKALRLQGLLNVAVLQQSFNEIVRRHEVLRTTFAIVEEQPVQVIAPTLNLTIPVIDLQEFPLNKREVEARRLTNEFAQQPFDLAKDPLLRVSLLQLSEAEYVLLLIVHHIVYDQWTKGILIQELVVLYEAFSKGQPSPLPELPIQYADFAVWEQQWLQSEKLQTNLSYWKQQLDGASATLDLPTDRPRPAVWGNQGAMQSLVMPKSLTKALNALSQQEEATLFMTLLAALNILLYRYTSQEDILIGTTISGRTRVELEKVIGFFINTQVMRTDLSGNPPFKTLLQRVREVALRAYEHRDLPFEKLVNELNIERDLSRNPLFQVAFVLEHNTTRQSLELPGLTLKPLEIYSGTAKFDLTLFMADTEQGLIATLEYSTELFNAATITRMLRHFQTLLEGIVANPNQRLLNLPFLTEAERQTLLIEWNDTQTDYPHEQCIHQLFEAQVERSPDTIAVVFEDQQLTYQELNAKANQLAHYLQKLGVGPEILVGICVERVSVGGPSPDTDATRTLTFDMIIGLLGILKAGGAYVPLDPAYPQERLAFMLSDSQVSVLLTQQKLLERLPEHEAQVICFDTDWDIISKHSQDNPTSISKVDNLAYVIYTSGSTGQPKGVFGLHRGAVNRFHWMWQNYPFVQGEICCQKTSLNFVDSVWEIFGPLLQGVPTVIVPDEVVKNPQQFVVTLADNNVTRLVLVPSLLRILLNTYTNLQFQLPQLKLWVSSGEALSIDLLQQFRQSLPDSTLLNLYGSSEVSADVTCCSLNPHAPLPKYVSIGHAIANTQIYILDANRQPVGVGVPGELHIGGDGLARGYLNRPELTAEKFIPNPFSEQPATRLYKTGDLARYLPNGEIEYLGRIDHQVKVRGFRIELGEIEAHFRQHPKVRETVVVVRSDSADSQRVVAYIVPQKEQTLTITELRDFLESKLPNYMVPAAFVMLEALPLTPNGKVDRKALPAPEGARPELKAVYQAPQTEVEKTIATFWQEALNFEDVGIHDNFFELGGHSLLLVQVHSKLQNIFQRDFPLVEMFQYPTISHLAKYLGQESSEQESFTQHSHRRESRTASVQRRKQARIEHRAAHKGFSSQ